MKNFKTIISSILFVFIFHFGIAQDELNTLSQKYTDTNNRFIISYPSDWSATPVTRADKYVIEIKDKDESGFVWVRYMYLSRAMDANTLLYQIMYPAYLNSNPGSEVAQQRSLTPDELNSYQVSSGEYILFKTPDNGFNVYAGYLVLCKQYEGNNGEIYTSVWDVKWEAPSFANIETIKQLPKIGMSITPF